MILYIIDKICLNVGGTKKPVWNRLADYSVKIFSSFHQGQYFQTLEYEKKIMPNFQIQKFRTTGDLNWLDFSKCSIVFEVKIWQPCLHDEALMRKTKFK